MAKSTGDILNMIAVARKRLSGNKKDKKKVDEKKKPSSPSLNEFDNSDDWMMTMILVAILRTNPEASDDDVVRIGKDFVKRLHMPRTNHLWRKQLDRVKRTGVRAAASRIRRELFELI
jgi:hypothetical protein